MPASEGAPRFLSFKKISVFVFPKHTKSYSVCCSYALNLLPRRRSQILSGDPAAGTSITDGMPALPSEADLKPPSYADATAADEGANTLPGDAYNGKYFSAAELELLGSKPMPVNILKGTAKGPALSQVEAVAVSPGVVPETVLTTSQGVPVLLNGMSPAVTHYDYSGGSQCGVRSTDPCLNSTEAFMQYFNTYNTRPMLGLEVEGCVNQLLFFCFSPRICSKTLIRAPTHPPRCFLGAAACYFYYMLTAALLMTSSHSEGTTLRRG